MFDFFDYLKQQWKNVKILDEDDESVYYYNQLIEFVESCKSSSEDVDKFICENWRLPVEYLVQLGMHKGIESESIRGSYSKMNTLFGNIFSFLRGVDFVEYVDIEYDEDSYIAFENMSLYLVYYRGLFNG